MASLIAHAALPLVAAPVFASAVEPRERRRVLVLAVACACLPDLDVINYARQISATQPLGHRGLTHSLLAAAAMAVGLALLFLRSMGVGSAAWRRATGLLFLAGASHGLFDGLTAGDVGVAFFAPFDWHRYYLPWHAVPVCPLGINEYLSRWGFWTVVDEFLYVVTPVALAARTARSWLDDRSGVWGPARIQEWAIWALVLAVSRTVWPTYVAPFTPRAIREATGVDDDLSLIPHQDLPHGQLVTQIDELRQLGLFNRPLSPPAVPWGSTFFPSWYGGEGGRWQDGSARLIARTLFGMSPPTAEQATAWLEALDHHDPQAAARVFDLAPTEKLDLAYHHLDFPLTRATLARTHNGTPRYWTGRCNGVSGAAMAQPEPFRTVDVIGVDGQHIRFHPNDVKSLLAVAYSHGNGGVAMGGRCHEVSFDSGATCSMNPAGLVVALLNWVGIGRKSFIVNAHPNPAAQHYPVAEAQVNLVGAPRSLGAEDLVAPEFRVRIAQLQDVEVRLELSSTELPFDPANRLDPASADGTRYLKVGPNLEHLVYPVTLALGPDGQILGGRWNGFPGNGPDLLFFGNGGPPALAAPGSNQLAAPEVLGWPIIRELARASALDSPAEPVLDLRTQCDGRCPS